MSANEKRKVVGSTSYGSRPKRLKEEIQTMKFCVHDFANQTEERGTKIMLPSIRAFGYDWTLEMYPRGNHNSLENIENISCYLKCDTELNDNEEVAVMCTFSCKGTRRKSNIFIFKKNPIAWGSNDYLQRKDVLEKYLDEDGTLVIYVDLQVAVDKKDDDVWYPEPLQQEPSLVKLYHTSEATADTFFDVHGKEYCAHKLILSLRAKALCEMTTKDADAVIPIHDVEGPIFEKILEYIYSVRTPEIQDEETATKFLLASDRLDCSDLKLYIESTIVDKFLNPSNAAKFLLVGDSYSCPLLKERAMKIYETDADIVMESKEDWSKVVESNRLLSELLQFCTTKQPPVVISRPISSSNSSSSSSSSNSDVIDPKIIEKLDVTSLRERLVKSNISIDGNREMLVERLKEQYNNHNFS